MSSDEEAVPGDAQNKKRSTGQKNAADANEEAFWLDSAGLTSEPTAGDALTSSRNDHVPSKAPLLYQRLHAQAQIYVAPFSPPPSHRKAVIATPQNDASGSTAVSPPSTPRTRSATKRVLLDSPNNPFVSAPQKMVDGSDTPSPSASSANPSPHTPHELEKPTITYMLYVCHFRSLCVSAIDFESSFSRGVKRVYRNPLYNHEEDRPYSPPPASKLPIEHPDYSPALNCSPKLLFPEARRGKGKLKKSAAKAPATKSKKRAHSPSLSGDEADEGVQEIWPIKLDFGGPDKKPTQGS